jgi:membrane-bound lytic murein transglycosylase D
LAAQIPTSAAPQLHRPRRRALVASLLLLAGCAPQRQPEVAPAPAASARLPRTAADSFTVTQSGYPVGPPVPVVAMADLDRRATDLFGDMLRGDSLVNIGRDADELGGGDVEPTWDIDVRSYETVDRVRYYVSMFSTYARDEFAARLGRGTRYESMIRARLRAGDLPEDMYYLALIESGFNPHAYSRAAAVGMWQFMASTASGMGMRVDWWVDERRDPIRSTQAAVGFLRYLREQFGSMYLAAAAYNGGPGRIARGLSRYSSELEGQTGDDMFFSLAEKKFLRNETREYVPQLIASALIAKEPAKYGIAIDTQPAFAYDSVRVGPRVAIAAIAQASGTTVPLIQELNPHILRGMIPPRDSMTVRIPVGTRALFDSTFDSVSSVVAMARWVEAPRGATWVSLARNSGVSARAVSSYNPKVKADRKTGVVARGTMVLIPTSAIVAAALPVPDPTIERWGSRSARSYVVRRGDNLSRIAQHFHSTPAAIMQLNRMQKPMIFPGQELLIRR